MSTPAAPSTPAGTRTLPQRARVVVIGGGVIGTSIAYHLAHLGVTDVLLLERDRLTSGTTWHAAGLMTCFGSTSETNTALRLYSRDLYARLEAETGVATGFKRVGLIEAAADADRLHEYRRVAAFQRHVGLEVEEIGPREMAELFPLARTDDLLAGFHVPGDGRVNPVDVTMSLARGARNLGVRVVEGVSVEQVITRPRGLAEEVVGVRTDAGDVECELVVNCAGMWARELAERNGVVVPNQAAEHYYLVTEPIDGMSPDAPVFEDPASYGYYREEGGGMMVGLFEPVAAAWKVDGIPRDFSFGEITPDWDRMGPFVERAISRVPVVETVGIRTFFCGPESFTPDLAPAVGEAPGIHGYFVCAGLNSVGILSAGGLGRVVAQWMTDGHPDVDVTGFDVARFRDWQLEPEAPWRAHRGDPRHGVCRAHPGHRARLCARGVPLAGARPAGRRGGPAARRQRVGVGGLVRRPRPGRTGRAGLGPPALVRELGGRAPCGARGRGPDGHVVHGQVRGARAPTPARCSTGSAPVRSTPTTASSPTPSGSARTAASWPTSP